MQRARRPEALDLEEENGTSRRLECNHVRQDQRPFTTY